MSLFHRRGETAVLPMDVVPGQEPGVGGAPLATATPEEISRMCEMERQQQGHVYEVVEMKQQDGPAFVVCSCCGRCWPVGG